jgi:hypothetical protein
MAAVSKTLGFRAQTVLSDIVLGFGVRRGRPVTAISRRHAE